MTRAEQLAGIGRATTALVAARQVLAQDRIHAARMAEIHARRYGG